MYLSKKTLHYCYKLPWSALSKYIIHHTMAQTADKNPVLSAFQRLRRRLQNISVHITGDAEDAEDALQDAFIKLWMRRAEINSTDEAAAIMTTTVQHLSIDRIRSRNAKSEVPIDDNRDMFIDDSDDLQSEIDERFLQIQHIIATRLTVTQQRVLQLRDYENREYEDIAQTLQMQPAAVRMQLSRARKAVRDIYREQQSLNK